MEETEGKKIVCRKPDTIREVLWSELVADLLGDIIARLCVADRVRFRAVCKSWRDARPVTNAASSTTSMLSWFVSVDSTSQIRTRALECRLFDPSYSVDEPVSVHTISFTELDIPEFPVLPLGCISTFCKQGWLFISIIDLGGRSDPGRIYFVLFSPLTKKLRQLPSLTTSMYFEHTFSSDPESEDCVFLLLDTCKLDEITVSTCRKGDTRWSTVRTIKVREDFRLPRPMYTRGLFYIISHFGKLVSYNVIGEKFNFENLDGDDDFRRIDIHKRCRVFTRNGELMYNYRCNGTKRFDWSNKVWIPVSSSLTEPPALTGIDKCTRVEDMIGFSRYSESECQCSPSIADHLMYKPSDYVFESGSIDQQDGTKYFWLEPPLLH